MSFVKSGLPNAFISLCNKYCSKYQLILIIYCLVYYFGGFTNTIQIFDIGSYSWYRTTTTTKPFSPSIWGGSYSWYILFNILLSNKKIPYLAWTWYLIFRTFVMTTYVSPYCLYRDWEVKHYKSQQLFVGASLAPLFPCVSCKILFNGSVYLGWTVLQHRNYPSMLKWMLLEQLTFSYGSLEDVKVWWSRWWYVKFSSWLIYHPDK